MDKLIDISFDALGDVANNLIDKLADAVGWTVNHSTPQREALRTFIEGVEASELDPLQKAALISNSKKIIKEYTNQCAIVNNALQFIAPSAAPQSIDSDWIAQFMDKGRLVSNPDFQLIWGRILAEECNTPNSIPKGLLHILEQMDRNDAIDFSAICSVSVKLIEENGVVYSPVILYREHEDYYKSIGLTYDSFVNLQSIGLIEFELNVLDHPYFMNNLIAPAKVYYHDEVYELPEGNTEINIGDVIFTRSGTALCKAITAVKHDDFFENYCIPHWENPVSLLDDILV